MLLYKKLLLMSFGTSLVLQRHFLLETGQIARTVPDSVIRQLTFPLRTGGSRGTNLGHKNPHLSLYWCGISLLALTDTGVLVDKLHC